MKKVKFTSGAHRLYFSHISFPSLNAHMPLSLILVKICFHFPPMSFSHVRCSCFCAVGMIF